MPMLHGGSYNQKPGKSPTGQGFDQMFRDYGNAPQTSLEDLTKKHLANVPRADIPRDPEKIYENLMGPARQDIQRATDEIGLGLQKFATGGSSYEDLLSRFLPGAIEPLADTASQAGVSSQEFAQKGAVAQSQADIARQNVASEMAMFEKEVQEDSRRFMLDLKSRIEMAEREIRAKERIALQGARSAEHIARIRGNAQRETARIAANAQMETTKYAQGMENQRSSVRMQIWDKQVTGDIRLGERKENRLGVEAAARYPNVPREGEGGGADRFGGRDPLSDMPGISDNPPGRGGRSSVPSRRYADPYDDPGVMNVEVEGQTRSVFGWNPTTPENESEFERMLRERQQNPLDPYGGYGGGR